MLSGTVVEDNDLADSVKILWHDRHPKALASRPKFDQATLDVDVV
jgi:hypothetical protein